MEASLPILTEQAIEEIERLVREYGEYGWRFIIGGSDQIDEEIASGSIERACLSTVVLLEQFGERHKTLLAEVRTLLESVKEDPLKVVTFEGEAYLAWSSKLRGILDIFKSLHIQREREVSREISELLEVVRNSEYYITDRRVFGSVPCSEADVHLRIEGLLKCLYADVQPKPRLSKPIKGFEPDTGILSLRTLIEYKFITNAGDGRKIVDQILADIGGYHSSDYDKFVFVIYETTRLFPLSDWSRAIEASQPSSAVEVVVIKGVHPAETGGRKGRKTDK